MIRTAIWLTGREILRRKTSVAIAIGAMAAAIAVCVATDFVAESRDFAVAAKIDHMGPGVIVLPQQMGSADMLRFTLGETPLPQNVAERISRILPGQIRTSEQRLLLQVPLAGRNTPAVGIEPADIVTRFASLQNLQKGEVVLGASLARDLNRRAGDELELMGQNLRVTAVLPPAQGGEDGSLFLTLGELQQMVGRPNAVNAVYLYAAPGVARADIASQLTVQLPSVSVIAISEADEARRDIDGSLNKNRRALYLIMGVVSFAFIMVWTFLDAEDRRPEIATLVAIGGSAQAILLILASRAVILGIAAAFVGYVLGIGVGFAFDAGAAGQVFVSAEHLLVWSAAAVVVCLIGSLPAALRVTFQDHVGVLRH